MTEWKLKNCRRCPKLSLCCFSEISCLLETVHFSWITKHTMTARVLLWNETACEHKQCSNSSSVTAWGFSLLQLVKKAFILCKPGVEISVAKWAWMLTFVYIIKYILIIKIYSNFGLAIKTIIHCFKCFVQEKKKGQHSYTFSVWMRGREQHALERNLHQGLDKLAVFKFLVSNSLYAFHYCGIVLTYK